VEYKKIQEFQLKESSRYKKIEDFGHQLRKPGIGRKTSSRKVKIERAFGVI
jgi:hypothetical protein